MRLYPTCYIRIILTNNFLYWRPTISLSVSSFPHQSCSSKLHRTSFLDKSSIWLEDKYKYTIHFWITKVDCSKKGVQDREKTQYWGKIKKEGVILKSQVSTIENQNASVPGREWQKLSRDGPGRAWLCIRRKWPAGGGERGLSSVISVYASWT